VSHCEPLCTVAAQIGGGSTGPERPPLLQYRVD